MQWHEIRNQNSKADPTTAALYICGFCSNETANGKIYLFKGKQFNQLDLVNDSELHGRSNIPTIIRVFSGVSANVWFHLSYQRLRESATPWAIYIEVRKMRD